MNVALHPILIPYASHFLLFERVDDRSVSLLQAAFPARFRRDQDAAALGAAEDASGSVLPAFEAAGYLAPAPALRPDEPRAWTVSEGVRAVLQQELVRYWASHAPADAGDADERVLRGVHARLAGAIQEVAADTAADESLFGELAVQLRRSHAWAELEDLWYRMGMRIIVTQPRSSFEAFSDIPEHRLVEHPGLRFAHTYVASTSIMQRVASGTIDDDVNTLVSRLSLQVTELTASIGPRWRELGSPDARINVGLNWMRHLRLRGEFDEAFAVLDGLYRQLGSVSAPEQPVSDRNVAFLKLEQGILLFFLGRWAEAIEVLRDCALLWQRPGYGDYVPAFADALSALIYALLGAPGPARESLARAHRIFGEVVDFNYISVLTTTVEAMLALDRLEIEAASEAIHRLDYLAPDSELWSVAAAIAQRVDLVRGDAAGALLRLRLLSSTAVGTHRLSPVARELQSVSRIEALQSAGHLQRARELARRKTPLPVTLATSLARQHLIAGRLEEALHLVEPSKLVSVPVGRERVCLLIIGAAAQLRLDRAAEADELLRIAVAQAASIASLLPFGLVPGGDRARLLARASALPEWSALARAVELDPDEATRRVSALPAVFPDSALLVDLSSREVQVLGLLDAKTAQADMAKQLNVSLSTVKKQVAALYRKLGAASRGEALVLAHQLGLLDERTR